jgi:hypothetical protein
MPAQIFQILQQNKTTGKYPADLLLPTRQQVASFLQTKLFKRTDANSNSGASGKTPEEVEWDNTVEPRYNEPCYNEFFSITNENLGP